ncbi:MAG: helix-turn-helix domain-containing protein [Firmicutes bacterium]|nr:helix-turn-helix domain-containing protein [Bacillota bacterium]
MQYNEIIGYKSPARVRVKLEHIISHPFHLHSDAIEILCVLYGSVKVWDSAAIYQLQPGAVHIFNRNDAHKIASSGENAILTIHIDSNHYRSFFAEIDDMYFISDTPDGQESVAPEMRHLRFLLARLEREYEEHSSAFTLEEHTRQLIDYLSEQFSDYIYGTDGKRTPNIVRLQATDQEMTPGGLRRNDERIYRIADFVEDHFREKLQLRQLAAREGVTEAHLSRYIHHALGMTFSQFLSLIRCEEASRLLASTDQTVDQIAGSSGFSDRKELAKHFRRWYQRTPAQYRREIQRDLRMAAGIRSTPADREETAAILERYLDEY